MLDLLFGPRPRAISIPQITTGGDVGWSGDGIYTRVKTRSGVTLDNEVALTYAAVLQATRIYAEPLGGLPFQLHMRTSEDDRQIADIPLGNVFKIAPNPDMTATPFRESRVAHQINWDGGGFAEIEFNPRSPFGCYLWPIHPSRVSRPWENDSPYDYLVRNNDGSQIGMYADEILHIPGIFPNDGIWSKGVLTYGRETVGGGLGVDRAAYANLGSGGQPKGILKAPGLQDRDKRAEFRKEWEAIHGNPEVNVPTIAIVNREMEYTAIAGDGNREFIESRRINKTDIPTLYNLPAYKFAGAMSQETAGTVEQKAIEFVLYSLMPVGRKWEEQCAFKLLSAAQQAKYYFEFNYKALLKGDTPSRYNAYRVAFSIGLMTINEMRRLENMETIGEAGDQHFIPANMTTAERALNGDFGNGGAMGSDHNGQPSDNPMDRNNPDQQAAQLESWLKSLGKIRGGEARHQLQDFGRAIPHNPVDYREGARLALTDVLGRMLTKESNAAQTAMKGNADFESWLREFYAKHEGLMVEALASACWNLRAAGVAKWGQPGELAAWLKARNVEALQRCYNTDSPDTAARRLRAWPTDRAKELVDEILGADSGLPAIIAEAPKPTPLETAVEALAKAMTKQAEAKPTTPAPITIHNHLPPKTNDIVERDKDGRIAKVIRKPILDN
jgi:HK97 family phage portal protein